MIFSISSLFSLPELFLENLLGQKIDRSSLTDEVEPLKDTIVSLGERFSKLWGEYDQLNQRVDRLEKETADLRAENIFLKAETLALKPENLALKEELAILKKKIFGKKSEKAPKKSSGNANENRPNKNHPGRNSLPSHLIRERVVHDIDPSEKVCGKCQGLLSPIGEEISEQLELVRSHLKVIEHARLKYACKCCRQTVVVAKTPYKPIEKGLAGPSLMAYVVVSKFLDHLPLYRQENIFKRHHVSINRSTLCGWIMAAAKSLKPLYERMREDLLSGNHLYTDDTHLLTLRVTGKDKGGKAHRAYIWVYARDDNHGQKPIVIYNYTLGRGSDSIEEFLKDFKGYIQADAYGAYDFLFKVSSKRKTVCIEVACWAHTRRKFVDAITANPESIASEVVELIGKLYDLEREFKINGLKPKEIRQERQSRSKPLLIEIHQWLNTHKKNVPPASTLGKAISYARGNWKALTVFIKNGKLAIDNNFSERNIKTVVLGRKNYLFAGSEVGGESAAVLYSLMETCKQNGIDPEAYLADVLLKVQYHPNHRIDELLPYHWKPPEKLEEEYQRAA